MKRKVLWLLTVTVLFVALFPLAIDRFILGNSYPSNASNAEWMSFFGGYFGAIIGGFLSLVGIAFTIRFTREESRADRELQIRPVFDIYCHYLSEVKENWLGYVMVCVNDSNDSAAEFTRRGAAFVRLKNVGIGPAININFEVAEIKELADYSAHYNNQNEMVTTGALQAGEQAGLTIDIFNKKKAPTKIEYDNHKWNDGTPMKPLEMFPKNYQLAVSMCYDDLIGNRFSQEMLFNISYYLGFEESGEGKFSCNIYLEDTKPPMKMAKANKRRQ